jgi:hypothetical protein
MDLFPFINTPAQVQYTEVLKEPKEPTGTKRCSQSSLLLPSIPMLTMLSLNSAVGSCQ